MHSVIRYDSTTRDLFEVNAQVVLDRIQRRYEVVEVEKPENGSEKSQWFVQIYRKGIEDNPEGFFGDTCVEAASRLAKALKIELI